MSTCRSCGAETVPYSKFCSGCGTSRYPDVTGSGGRAPATHDTARTVGIIGALVLFVGVFAPIVSLPIVGPQNYVQNGQGDGVILIGLALVSLLLAVQRAYRGLWLTGLGSLAVLAFTFVIFQSKLAEMKRELDAELAGNPFRGLADLAVQSVQLQWGWAVLIIGAGLLLTAAGIGSREVA